MYIMKLVNYIFTISILFGITRADYYIWIYDDGGNGLTLESSSRQCACLTNTQTAQIENISGGTVKTFSSSDCTGNYGTISLGSTINNAQWVNSVSFGPSGSSAGPHCCDDLWNECSVAANYLNVCYTDYGLYEINVC